MKLSYEWLKDFVDVRQSPQKLADSLTMAGLEVESLETVGRDAHMELGVTPNRGDCLSIIGVAREVAAITGKKLKSTAVRPVKGNGAIARRLKVAVKASARCPRYSARVIDGVRIGPSPAWMVKRLAVAGIRSINNVVDATNYVMIERGQPLHAFDARLIEGGKIIVRTAGATASFRTLDGVQRALAPDDLLICDGVKPVALAGIMGGENSEVTPSTTSLVLESAYFESAGVRRTATRLGLASESSRRFERGVDPGGVVEALHRLVALIALVAGGTPSEDWIDAYPRPVRPLVLSFDAREVTRLGGCELAPAAQRALLTRLGFRAAGSGARMRVTVPCFRPDVTRPVDLVEEILRIHGYAHVPLTMPQMRVAKLEMPRGAQEAATVREELVARGYSEAVLMAFEEERWCAPFAAEEGISPAVIANPLSREESVMRTHLMPGLIKALALNVNRQRRDVKLFALQRVYRRPVGKVHASEPMKLAGIVTGRRNPRSWSANALPADFYDAKGAVDAVFSRMKLDDQVLYQRGGTYEFLVPGSYAVILCANQRVGWVGELHPSLLERAEIRQPVFGFEFDFGAMAALSRAVAVKFRELHPYPFVERDLSILVDTAKPHVEVEKTILQSVSTLLTDVRVFDVYRGKGIPEDKKSVTYCIRYASEERTLTDDEVNAAHAKVIDAVTTKLGAVLR